MYVVILNWNGGENDPFTSYNQVLASYFEACGKLTKTLQLTDNHWPSQLLNLKCDGIDFVFTWQGLGTRCTAGEQGLNLWDVLQVPLIVFHGDHPSHMPANHFLEGRYCTHLYSNPEFSRYASAHFRKQSRALAIDPPFLSSDTPLGKQEGEFFVFSKNITPPPVTEGLWKRELSELDFSIYMDAAESLKALMPLGDYVDFHPVLDDLISVRGYESLEAKHNPIAYHRFHSQLDFYIRNHKSVTLLSALKDVPMRIFGRGWEMYETLGNHHHEFFPGVKMADSQFQYYSTFGIVDVTPSMVGLHDRTLRALQNETPFVSSAYLPGFLPDMARFDPLFYRFNGADLREKCEAVMANPTMHAELAKDFSHQYQLRVHPHDFVKQLDLIARTIDIR